MPPKRKAKNDPDGSRIAKDRKTNGLSNDDVHSSSDEDAERPLFPATADELIEGLDEVGLEDHVDALEDHVDPAVMAKKMAEWSQEDNDALLETLANVTPEVRENKREADDVESVASKRQMLSYEEAPNRKALEQGGSNREMPQESGSTKKRKRDENDPKVPKVSKQKSLAEMFEKLANSCWSPETFLNMAKMILPNADLVQLSKPALAKVFEINEVTKLIVWLHLRKCHGENATFDKIGIELQNGNYHVMDVQVWADSLNHALKGYPSAIKRAAKDKGPARKKPRCDQEFFDGEYDWTLKKTLAICSAMKTMTSDRSNGLAVMVKKPNPFKHKGNEDTYTLTLGPFHDKVHELIKDIEANEAAIRDEKEAMKAAQPQTQAGPADPLENLYGVLLFKQNADGDFECVHVEPFTTSNGISALETHTFQVMEKYGFNNLVIPDKKAPGRMFKKCGVAQEGAVMANQRACQTSFDMVNFATGTGAKAAEHAIKNGYVGRALEEGMLNLINGAAQNMALALTWDKDDMMKIVSGLEKVKKPDLVTQTLNATYAVMAIKEATNAIKLATLAEQQKSTIVALEDVSHTIDDQIDFARDNISEEVDSDKLFLIIRGLAKRSFEKNMAGFTTEDLTSEDKEALAEVFRATVERIKNKFDPYCEFVISQMESLKLQAKQRQLEQEVQKAKQQEDEDKKEADELKRKFKKELEERAANRKSRQKKAKKAK